MSVDKLWITHFFLLLFPRILTYSVDNSKWLLTTPIQLERIFGLTVIKSIHGMFRIYPYSNIFVKDLLHRIKFEGEFDCIQPLGKQLGQAINELESQMGYTYDIITFIPADYKRKIIRGFHCVEVIANQLHLTTVQPLFIKLISTPLQSKQDKKSRKRILEGVYSTKGVLPDLTNKKILLLDDIITTGSTIEACAKLLKNQDSSVLIDVLCITGGKPV